MYVLLSRAHFPPKNSLILSNSLVWPNSRQKVSLSTPNVDIGVKKKKLTSSVIALLQLMSKFANLSTIECFAQLYQPNYGWS